MNRTFSKKMFYLFSKVIPFELLRQVSGQHFILPFYHLVSDEPSPMVKHLYPVVSESHFRQDLDFIKQHFSPATFDEVQHFAVAKKYKGAPKFYLSFDDGFAECYHVVRPILKEKGLSAVFFVNPAFIGNRMLSHRQKISLIIDHLQNDKYKEHLQTIGEAVNKRLKNSDDLKRYVKGLNISDTAGIHKIAEILDIDFDQLLQKHKPYMDISQIRELKKDGFLIGSHSYDHPEFNLLSAAEMKAQAEKSFKVLSRELDHVDRVFSFPFHDIGVPQSFFDFLIKDQGLQVSFGTSGIKRDTAPRHLHRIPMEQEGLQSAEAILRAEYFYYLGKSLFQRNLVTRR